MSEIATLYLVKGSTGEYDDERSWIVCAYADHSTAKAHAETAEIEAERIRRTTDRYEHDPDEVAMLWDSGMEIAETGTSYRVFAVNVRQNLPGVPKQKEPATAASAR